MVKAIGAIISFATLERVQAVCIRNTLQAYLCIYDNTFTTHIKCHVTFIYTRFNSLNFKALCLCVWRNHIIQDNSLATTNSHAAPHTPTPTPLKIYISIQMQNNNNNNNKTLPEGRTQEIRPIHDEGSHDWPCKNNKQTQKHESLSVSSRQRRWLQGESLHL